METTTIQLSKETKNKLSSFGTKGESYDDILRRVYSLAVKEQLRAFLLSSEGTISIEDARKELNKKWPRSK
jgi:predicted CopG family antitoxin